MIPLSTADFKHSRVAPWLSFAVFARRSTFTPREGRQARRRRSSCSSGSNREKVLQGMGEFHHRGQMRDTSFCSPSGILFRRHGVVLCDSFLANLPSFRLKVEMLPRYRQPSQFGTVNIGLRHGGLPPLYLAHKPTISGYRTGGYLRRFIAD